MCPLPNETTSLEFELCYRDAFATMAKLPDGCIKALLTDPPYATTSLTWDKPIDWKAFWNEADRVCTDNAIVVMFSAQPFTTELINSNRKQFRYELIWEKTVATGPLTANRRPMRAHENILIFARHFNRTTYNPQKTPGKPYKSAASVNGGAAQYNTRKQLERVNTGDRHPRSVLRHSNARSSGSLHPTQKPLDLMRWIVRSYTNPGDWIFDPFTGSGSTGVAALAEERNFVGSELNLGYFLTARQRLTDALHGLIA